MRCPAALPALFDFPRFAAPARRTAPPGTPPMVIGSQPYDNKGQFKLTDAQRETLIRKHPAYAHWVRPMVGAKGFLQNTRDWVLWLEGATPYEVAVVPMVNERVNAVKAFREQSPHYAAIRAAKNPHLFAQRAQPATRYMALARTSSLYRTHMPVGVFSPDVIATSRLNLMPEFTPFDFAVLSSRMYNDWVRATGKVDKRELHFTIRQSHNAFSWPRATKAQRDAITVLAHDVLAVRERYPLNQFTELYHMQSMPSDLYRAHHALDLAIEALYRKRPFKDALERVNHLHGLLAKQAA